MSCLVAFVNTNDSQRFFWFSVVLFYIHYMGWCAQIKILLFLSCLTSFYLLFSFYFHFRSLISFTFTFQMLFSVVSYLLFYLVFCVIVFIIIFIISYTARYLEPKMSRKDQQLQCYLSRHTWKHVLLRLLEKQNAS